MYFLYDLLTSDRIHSGRTYGSILSRPETMEEVKITPWKRAQWEMRTGNPHEEKQTVQNDDKELKEIVLAS